jgi:hypothetical protein
MRAGRHATTGYRVAVDLRADGSAVALISRVVRTRATLLARVALASTWHPGDALNVDARLREGDTVSISMRAWVGSASPPGWQAKAVDRAGSPVTRAGRVYAWAQLPRSADAPLTLALRPLATATPSATETPTGPEPTTEPVPSDEFGPLGRPVTSDDLTALGWDDVQNPAADSVTLIENGVALGQDRPPGALLRAKLEPGETYTDGRCRAEVYGRRPVPWTTPAYLWPDPVGSERWYSFSVFVPEAFPVASDTTWLDFTQWKGYAGGTPPLALEIKRSNFRLGGARANSGLIPNDGQLGPIAFGAWTRFTVGIHYSTSADDGWVEVYRNGVLKLPRTPVATMDTYAGGPDPVYLKQGIYRSAKWTVRQALYFSPMTITETLPASP